MSNQVLCYLASWSNYRPSGGKFTPSDVDPSLCTVLAYAYAAVDPDEADLAVLDAWVDLEDNYGLGGYSKTVALKEQNPDLKVRFHPSHTHDGGFGTGVGVNLKPHKMHFFMPLPTMWG